MMINVNINAKTHEIVPLRSTTWDCSTCHHVPGRRRERQKGLYTADQNVNDNRGATATKWVLHSV